MTFITRISRSTMPLSFNEKICFFFSYLNTGFNPIICALKMRLLVFNSLGGGAPETETDGDACRLA